METKTRSSLHSLPTTIGAWLLTLAALTAADSPPGPPGGGPVQPDSAMLCAGHLKQVVLGGILWASQHDDRRMATNFMSMQTNITSPRFLVCPSSLKRGERLPRDWASFDTNRISYKMVSPGLIGHPTNHNQIYLRCPIHDNVAYGDGRVMFKVTAKP